jgi:hypothetical protein
LTDEAVALGLGRQLPSAGHPESEDRPDEGPHCLPPRPSCREELGPAIELRAVHSIVSVRLTVNAMTDNTTLFWT